jgi:flagellar hook-associated protein 3 FlgL
MSSIRVNPNILPDLLSSLAQTRQQQETATTQLATGSRINQPSDDPAGAAQMVSNRDQSSQTDSFLRSIGSMNGLLQTADSTLSSVVTALQRAISLGVEGANDTLSDSDRSDVANELQGIQQQLIGLANTSYQGEYIFSGTSTKQPFVADPSSSSGVKYQGNIGTNSVQVGPTYSVQVNQPGSQIFTAPGANVFQAISDVISALQANSGVDSAVSEMSVAFNHVTSQRVFYGNGINQLQDQQTYLNAEKVNLSIAANSISGADMANTAATLNQAEVAMNAEMAALGKIAQTSLFDYLK